jgi:hypothetical protein
MLFYHAGGYADDARIDQEQLKIAFANAPKVYAYPAPSSIDEELDIPPGKARLNVIGFSGLSPLKEEEAIRVPLPGFRYMKIALPVMAYRPSMVTRIEVSLNTGRTFDLELLENLEAVARETFIEKSTILYLKSIIRGTAKGVASSALSSAAQEVEDSDASLLLTLFSIGAQVFAEASEQADLRMSRYFPGRAYVGGVTLDPGIYSLRINYYTAQGRLLDSFKKENIHIREHNLNLVEAVCLK